MVPASPPAERPARRVPARRGDGAAPPGAAAAEPARQADALRAFARGREALTSLESLRATALERWLHVMLGEPERFAEAILLARIEALAPADAAVLRFLREARVPRHRPDVADLAIDRVALLEQASLWRYLEGDPMAAALAAARAWQRRYLHAYAEHYRGVVTQRNRLLREAEVSTARMDALERLNRIAALGAPDGRAAIAASRAAMAALAAMPDAAGPEAAVTAGVRFGEPNERAREFREATVGVEHALQSRLRRLSAELAACALDDDDGLPAVLNAIALSEMARIDALLTATARSPLAVVAQQFPEVTLANLEAAVEEFRRAALHAIDTSPDDRTALGGGSPTPTGPALPDND